MNSTRMLGTASNLMASNGANFSPSPFFGGVWGSKKQNPASTSDTTAATVNVLVSAASIAGPVFNVDNAVPSHFTKPPASLMLGTFAQSIGMKINGQLAAIHPIVPQTRMK